MGTTGCGIPLGECRQEPLLRQLSLRRIVTVESRRWEVGLLGLMKAYNDKDFAVNRALF